MLLLLATIALADPAVTQEIITDGPLKKRVSTEAANLVLYYGGEQHGVFGPCDCEERPKGSLARTLSYVDASRAASPPVPSLLLNAGGWADPRTDLHGEPSIYGRYYSTAMLTLLANGGWDAINQGWRELPLRYSHPKTVTANGGDFDEQVLYFGRVAVIGLTGAGPGFRAKGEDFVDPVDALTALMPKLDAGADVIVVLAYELGAATETIAAMPSVDVIIEASQYEQSYAPWTDADTVWVRSRFETQRIGELRLMLDGDGNVVSAVDRHIDLDSKVPSDKAMRRWAREVVDQAP